MRKAPPPPNPQGIVGLHPGRRSGWRVGDLSSAPMEENDALGHRRRRASQAGQGFPRAQATPPCSPTPEATSKSQSMAYRAREAVGRRDLVPPALTQMRSAPRPKLHQWPIALTFEHAVQHTACKPRRSHDDDASPAGAPAPGTNSLREGQSVAIPAATFTGAALAIPAAVSDGGKGKERVGGVAAAAEP